jgi:hypothetical protein
MKRERKSIISRDESGGLERITHDQPPDDIKWGEREIGEGEVKC